MCRLVSPSAPIDSGILSPLMWANPLWLRSCIAGETKVKGQKHVSGNVHTSKSSDQIMLLKQLEVDGKLLRWCTKKHRLTVRTVSIKIRNNNNNIEKHKKCTWKYSLCDFRACICVSTERGHGRLYSDQSSNYTLYIAVVWDMDGRKTSAGLQVSQNPSLHQNTVHCSGSVWNMYDVWNS